MISNNFISLETFAMPHNHNFDEVTPKPPPRNKYLSCFKTNALVIFTLSGVILGAILGFCLRGVKDWTPREQEYVGYVGDVFLQMLKSLIVPLIVSSLISAIASLDLSLSGKISARAISYYLTTTFAAVVLGMILVVSIRPGKGGSDSADNGPSESSRNASTTDTLLDLVKNMFPPNLIEACVFQYRTKSSDGISKSVMESVQTTNILGLVVASTAIGIALAQLGEEAKTLANLFHSLMAVMMRITTWVIWLSPLGVMFLVAYQVLQMADIALVLSSIGKYFGTVCLGLFIQGFVILPIIYYIMTRKNPVTVVISLGEAIATAFGTASSSATLPVTIRCLEDKLGVDRRVARFCLPIGSTINMDGTALYEAVAAIFIAQVRGIPLGIGKLIAISITATAASIGAAGIPQAGMVTLVMVLDTVGLNASDVTLIIALDWLLDRFRTAINVMGDSFGAAIVNHLSQKELGALQEEHTYANPYEEIYVTNIDSDEPEKRNSLYDQ
ncbi:excitatory amino acid transporter 1 [Anoplophora glabripennis]|uniref:excitatory amino acid transporter 1 n=1 Tax=Anoplophora glabripennis TaxID=217634 RepID=UPI0008757B78|nr:excitatory amino acid transporter 1 [Anoplophora glabripennis]